MNKIAVFCELNYENKTLKDVSFELLSKAQELKEQAKTLQNEDFLIEAIVVADSIEEVSLQKAYQAGADRLVLIKNENYGEFCDLTFSKAFVEYFLNNPSRVILFPATLQGRAIAPRVAALLDTGLVADCTQIEFVLKDNELKLAPTRPTFGSELMATILSKKLPECATIRPKTFKISFDLSRSGELVEFESNIQKDCKIKLIKTLLDESESIDFSNAKVILAAGFGLNEEYIEKLQNLAKLLGAEFASTRKLVDFNLTSQASQVGQTGSTVAPELYIAFGISGAIQHICGMKNSKTVVAINTDKDAPIFKYSDYKIVADARKIIDDILSLV